MSLALDEDIVEATLLKWTGGNVPTRLRSAGITAAAETYIKRLNLQGLRPSHRERFSIRRFVAAVKRLFRLGSSGSAATRSLMDEIDKVARAWMAVIVGHAKNGSSCGRFGKRGVIRADLAPLEVRGGSNVRKRTLPTYTLRTDPQDVSNDRS